MAVDVSAREIAVRAAPAPGRVRFSVGGHVVHSTDVTPTIARGMASAPRARPPGSRRIDRDGTGSNSDLAPFNAEPNVQIAIIDAPIAYRWETA